MQGNRCFEKRLLTLPKLQMDGSAGKFRHLHFNEVAKGCEAVGRATHRL